MQKFFKKKIPKSKDLHRKWLPLRCKPKKIFMFTKKFQPI